ncbi:MAG: ABC transporter permease [Elstera sp.]
MSPALTFALRELRGGVAGFRIFLACLTLGVAVIAAVGSLSAAIVAGLERDARSLLGGDITLRQVHRPIGEEPLAWLATQSLRMSQSIEMRAMAVRPDGERRSLAQLKAVDNAYPLLGAVVTEPKTPLPELLAERDGRFGVVVEEVLLARLGLKIGDMLQVGEGQFRVSAALLKEPDRATGPLDIGPRVLIANAAMPQTQLLQPGSLAEFHYKLLLKPSVSVASFRAGLIEKFPGEGWRVRDPSQASPQVERFIERLALFLTLVGLTSLLVGGVGVGNAVRAYLEGKSVTIATLKALGAPSAFIFRLYLMLIAVMAGGGTLVGLIIGAAAPWLAAEALGTFLPVPLAIGLYPAPLALAAVFGLLTALTFSLWPLGRAQRVSAASLFRDAGSSRGQAPGKAIIGAMLLSAVVLAALAILTAQQQLLATWFVGGAIASFGIFRLAAEGLKRLARHLASARWAGGRSPKLRLALANIDRPGAPTGSVVLSLGLGLAVLVTVALIEGNLNRQVVERLPDQAPAFFFIDIPSTQTAQFDALALGIPGASELRRVPSLRGRITSINGTPVEKAVIDPEVSWAVDSDRGLTYAATPPEGSEIVAGDWWAADYRGPLLVSLDVRLAEGFGVKIGESITVNVLGRNVEAKIANLRRIQWESFNLNFVLIFSPGLLDSAPHTHLATIHVPPGNEEAMLRQVGDAFPSVSAVRVRETLETVTVILSAIGAAARAVTGLTLVVGTLVLAGAVIAGHHRRVYDAIVLKVLGATRRDLLAAYALEYGLLGLATAFIAIAIGTLASWGVVTFLMRADWVFLPLPVGAITLLSLGITLVLGFAGTWIALGQKAAPLLRQG